MTRRKLINIHSAELNTDGDGPKLPTKNQIEYGELAVNIPFEKYLINTFLII